MTSPTWLPRATTIKPPAIPKKVVLTGLFAIALLAFEVFNFDTTRYALSDLLGERQFVGLRWASILALAFCAIDFAGLAKIFTPEPSDNSDSGEAWYILGAWLLGATMNAAMTWWAVSLTLVNNNFGNEVLSHSQLLHTVPVFVAVLVLMTRLLFIGSMMMPARSKRHVTYVREQPVPVRQPRRPVRSAENIPTPQPSIRPRRTTTTHRQPTYRESGAPSRPSFVPTTRVQSVPMGASSQHN